jgi:4'-phosphopantetheinyl transferase
MNSAIIYYASFGKNFDFSTSALEQGLRNLPEESFGESVRRYDHTAQRWMSLLSREVLLHGFKEANILLSPDSKWEVGNNGRPFVKDCPDFNISHSGKIAVCAIASGQGRVGIDVQAEKPMGDRRLRQVLTPRELIWVNGSPRKAAYLWSRKEAVSKLLGLGMRISYRSLETLKDQVEFEGRIFHLFTVSVGRGYQCTLAGEAHLSVSLHRYRWLSINQLVASSHSF